ncbi:MAG: CD225/dispanin family protein [Chlorobi bacterium]|nr:CD225/dispanin family protein [Chlorobiota bacterium]
MENQNSNQRPPKTWLVESILVTLFCCLPFGIAGIINAAKVESRFYAGDIEGAQRASREAAKWTKIGFWVSVVLFVIYIVLLFAGVLTAVSLDELGS